MVLNGLVTVSLHLLNFFSTQEDLNMKRKHITEFWDKVTSILLSSPLFYVQWCDTNSVAYSV
jgi:hypothetical protein